MRRSSGGLAPRIVTWLALAAGYAAMLRQDFPGHLSVDSVIELHEGHFHMRENWGPAIFPWLLGVFDRISSGTGLYLVVSALLLFGGWATLPQLRRRGSWWLALAAAGAVLTPDVLIYPGIIWHDVLFAETAVAGFLCLAFAARDWDGPRRPWVRLAMSVVLLAVASLVRQNGLVVLPMAALAVGWMAWRAGPKKAAGWGCGWLLAAMATTAVLAVTALPQGPGFESANGTGLRALATYDLTGAAARDPAVALPRIEREAPKSAAAIRRWSKKYWSPSRVDFVAAAPELAALLKDTPTAALLGDWKDMILQRPDLYWPERAEVFRWVFATPDIDRCLPVYLGIDGPSEQMKALGLTRVWGRREDRLLNYATWYYDTPALSHVAYAILALGLIGFLLWRREPTDGPVAAMLASGLVFTASFFPLSLACDYRYLYFLDMAVLTGVLYVAADPGLRRRRSTAGRDQA